ncbi:hypothetical protein J6590_060741 [Homalodisca vitripennis]|nr:hypothetical protein J6590_060741 [Homalodisca vitripennis]
MLRRSDKGKSALLTLAIYCTAANKLEKEGPWVSCKFGKIQLRVKKKTKEGERTETSTNEKVIEETSKVDPTNTLSERSTQKRNAEDKIRPTCSLFPHYLEGTISFCQGGKTISASEETCHGFPSRSYAYRIICQKVNTNEAKRSRMPNIIRQSSGFSFYSKAVWECKNALEEPAKRNKVTLGWVLGHEGIQGN